MTDEEIRTLWRSKGGSFHGPHVEMGKMPEHQLLPFLRELLTVPDGAVLVTPMEIRMGRGLGKVKPVVSAAKRLCTAMSNNLPANAEIKRG